MLCFQMFDDVEKKFMEGCAVIRGQFQLVEVVQAYDFVEELGKDL